MLRFTALIALLICFSYSAISQDKLVIDDRAGILSEALEQGLTERMADQGISYTSMVDFRDACSYYYGELDESGGDLILRIRDCDKKELGAKNLGAAITSASGEEQGLLLSYAIRDIISEPGRYSLGASEAYVTAGETADPQETQGAAPASDTLLSNEHDSRYFFSPSAYNLKKGELYYNTVYFFLHDIQYGFSDNFSMGMGTSLIGLPLYVTPKLSFPLGEKSSLGVGDMLMFGTWGTDFMGNLAYAVYTRGSTNGNFTLGAGHLWTNDNDLLSGINSVLFNFSAMSRISPYMFFMTENYFSSAKVDRTADYWSQLTNEHYTENFEQQMSFWYGILGIRVISKNRSFVAWQFGLTYIINYSGDIPAKYDSWSHDARDPGNLSLLPIPTVSFTVKFKTGY